MGPNYRMHVWPWIKGPAQRLIMPDWLAITIGHDVFAWRPLDEFELEHELTHIKQWDANGVLYPPRYFQASRAASAAGLDRYRGNAFEVEAYAAEDNLRSQRHSTIPPVPPGGQLSIPPITPPVDPPPGTIPPP